MTPQTDYKQSEPSAITADVVPELGADTCSCPECDTHLSVPHGSDGHVVFCPACGQCVAAPAPWFPAVTEWGWSRPHWPYGDEKYPGSVGC